MNQNQSVFMPGLTSRGPVYNALEGLPTLSPVVKIGAIAALLYFGAVKKKIPLAIAGAGAFAIWKFFPEASASNAPVIDASTNPIPDITSSLDFSNVAPPSPVSIG